MINRCRSCGSDSITIVGVLPDVEDFAGRRLTFPIKGGTLIRCNKCSLVLRNPLLTSSEYDELYRNGSANVWESASFREDFRIVRDMVSVLTPAGDILDVGCYTGLLLADFPQRYRLYGIEPNTAAAKIATERGIQIIGGSIDDASVMKRRFDLIIACDVIEHLPDPIVFLSTLRDRLNKGGKILITTGNSDAWLWRLSGARFWYCFYPEHITFLNKQWLNKSLKSLNLHLDLYKTFNYRRSGFSLLTLKLLAASLLYAITPAVYAQIRKFFRSNNSEQSAPPGCGATKDHILCVLTTK